MSGPRPATERIEIGTAVIPTPLRHPFQMAVQATTTQQACGGRFTLGIGLSHKIMMEDSMGLSFDKPVLQMRETLEALAAMLSGEAFDYQGELYKSRFAPFELGTPVEVLVAALDLLEHGAVPRRTQPLLCAPLPRHALRRSLQRGVRVCAARDGGGQRVERRERLQQPAPWRLCSNILSDSRVRNLKRRRQQRQRSRRQISQHRRRRAL